MADVLTLRVTEYVSPTEWRWELTGLGDEFISDHEVRLDATSQGYKTFCDLYGHLRLTADPRRRPAQESEILLRCGRWIGDTVFGPGIGSALLFYAPCTVHIRIPGEARALAGYPLESAVFGDATLQATGISLVLDVEDRAGSSFRAPSKEPVRDRLRILGLFTVPEGSSPLNLRRERTASP